MNRKFIAWICVMFAVCFLSACGIDDESGILKNLVKADALSPSYDDPATMNRYLQSSSLYITEIETEPAFVFEGGNVHFEDLSNYYTLEEENDTILFTPRLNAREKPDEDEGQEKGDLKIETAGMVISGVLYNGREDLNWSKDKDENMRAWKLYANVDSENYNYSLRNIKNTLPYDGGFYFIYEENLCRCEVENIEYFAYDEEEVCMFLIPEKEIEVLFDREEDIYMFGIYEDTIVLFCEDNIVWTYSIQNQEARCILDGEIRTDGSEYCVWDGYLYYIYYLENTYPTERMVARIALDGKGQQEDFFEAKCIHIMDGNLYFLQYSKLHETLFLFNAPLDDLDKPILLAFGEEYGLAGVFVSHLYPHGEWVYYASSDTGFWRAKIDGTLVEKIQNYSMEEYSGDGDLDFRSMKELAEQKWQVSDFVFEKHKVEDDISPDTLKGYCGAEPDVEDVVWRYKDGVLTISGKGEIDNPMIDGVRLWDDLRQEMTSIVIEEGITTIGSNAFFGLSHVTSVTLPDSLISIEKYAFYGTSLMKINFPDNLVSIGESAFGNLTTLSGELKLPDSLTKIGKAAFYGCTNLTGELKLPNSLQVIEEVAFKGCSGLTGNLTIPGGVEVIEHGIFADCSGLDGTLTFSEGVRILKQTSFHDCYSLKALDIPASMEKIESNNFMRCSNIETITWHGTDKCEGFRYLPKQATIVHAN